MRRISLLILLCALSVPGLAAASSTGSLTSVEYAQLATVRTELKSVNPKTTKGLKAALWDCQTIQEVSPLLTEERSDCIAQLQIGDFSAVVTPLVKHCSAAYKDVADRLKCMVPTYEKLYNITSSFYHSESSIQGIATSRGFTTACTNLLSDPPKVIGEEKRMLAAFSSMIAEMKVANALAVAKYSGELVTASAEVQQGQDANKGPLSVCPHQ